MQIVVIHTEPGGPHLFKIIHPCRRHQRPWAVHLGDLITSKVGSHRELIRKDQSGQLTRSTIGAILRYERSLSQHVLIRVLTVCELGDKEQEGWMDAWERYGRPRRKAMEELRRSIAYSRLHPDASASLPGSPGERGQ